MQGSKIILKFYIFAAKNYWMQNYLDELNESQREAVLYNDGPSLVIAGAGSGKTRVLTYKIAYLLSQGYQSWEILALTFTNKAAREMKERILRQVGKKGLRLWMGTFHSIFSRILRKESEHIGFSSNFTIYDASDSKSLIKTIVKELGLDDKKYKVTAVQSQISKAKNRLISPVIYINSAEIRRVDAANNMERIGDIYRIYDERCKIADAMDFDDLLVYMYKLLNENEEIRRKYNELFRFILVDEYQDTNYAQHKIVQLLTKANARICVVGDDAQSIYSFRGANIDNILSFQKIYPTAKVFKLEQNYRSSQNIVNAANSLIAKNQYQIKKRVFSEKEEGDLLHLDVAYSDIEEGEIVAKHIRSLQVQSKSKLSDCAILYRTNAQSRVFEEVLRKRAIPYKIYGGLSFYARKEIKDIIAYFRLIINPYDEEAFKRVLNYPARGIGNTTLNKLKDAALSNQISLWQILEGPLEYGVKINNGTANKLRGFQEMIHSFMQEAKDSTAFELANSVVKKTRIAEEFLKDSSPESQSKRENVDELLNGIHDFCMSRKEEGDEQIYIHNFLSEVSLLTDQDLPEEEDLEKVTLMTVHAAKGLEFKNVFVVGMEQELFPSQRSIGSHRALEEERRLFYVAITRAEERCFLSYAKMRYKYGKQEFCTPSSFLKDIDTSFLALKNKNTTSRLTDVDRKPSFFETRKGIQSTQKKNRVTGLPRFKKIERTAPSQEISLTNESNILKVGQIIEHNRFGVGEVEQVVGVGENQKATIRFENVGTKQLLLKFARFKIIKK